MNPKESAPIFLMLVAIAASVASPGARFPRPQQEPAKPIHVESDLVLVEATVKDKSGKVVDGLTANDFCVLDDGNPQSVSHFSRDELPLAVALVVDVSESIVPYFDQLHDSTQTVLSMLKREDQAALFTFSDNVKKRADLTTDRQAVADQFEGIGLGGSTNLNDALYEAARYLGERAPSMRRVIILVSDNVPSQEGKFSPKEVENEILKADTAVYGLKIPGDNPYGVWLYVEQAGPTLVNAARIAQHSGGEIINVSKEGSLPLAFAAVIQRLRARYTLGYTPFDHPLQDGRYHSIEVLLVPGRCRHCRVETKRGYFGATPASVQK
jgi:VWFA-related protein